jgi:serine/threonine protein kinase
VIDISFLDTAGQRASCTVEVEFDEASGPGAHMHSRLLRVLSATGLPPGVQYLRQRLVAGKLPLSQSEPYDLLDNEIRIGLHLVRRFRSGPYPAELSQLVGYDIDADEPFALFLPYGGEPAAKAAGRLTLDQQREFEIGIFRALQLLAQARVVHSRLSPDVVRWDDPSAHVQLVDFSRAALAGEPTQAGTSPWNPPAQLGETRPATPADDVWSAGALTYYAATGRQLDSPSETTTLRGHMQTLLDGVFSSVPAERPSAAQLLRRLRVPDPWLGEDDTDPRFAAGQREFDQITAAKQAAVAPAPPASHPERSPRKPPRRWHWPLLMMLTIIAVAVVALIVETS